MANSFEDIEAEAVSILMNGVTGPAWQILQEYFQRRFDFERDQCVQVPKEKVEVHQGMARAFNDCINLSKDMLKHFER